MEELRISFEDLVASIGRVLAGAGVPEPVRSVEAEVMAEADLLGVPSHGVRMLPGLVKAFREGRANPAPRMQVVREHGATCVLDCDMGPGRAVSVEAMARAVERARSFGVGVCLAVRTTHWGRAHAYACRAAREGMIGLCTTNANPNMLAWGSSVPLLGNNPIALAAPREGDEDPIVLDMAMSQASWGKVGTYRREGKKAPEPWGVDASGRPTDDPAAILESRRLLPLGGHKGAGLGLMMELLTGALAGGPLSQETVLADPTGFDSGASKFFLALDVAAFGDRTRFTQKVEDLAGWLRAAEPGLEIRFPGDRGWRARDRYRAEGIPLHPEIADELRAIGFPLTRGPR